MTKNIVPFCLLAKFEGPLGPDREDEELVSEEILKSGPPASQALRRERKRALKKAKRKMGEPIFYPWTTWQGPGLAWKTDSFRFTATWDQLFFYQHNEIILRDFEYCLPFLLLLAMRNVTTLQCLMEEKRGPTAPPSTLFTLWDVRNWLEEDPGVWVGRQMGIDLKESQLVSVTFSRKLLPFVTKMFRRERWNAFLCRTPRGGITCLFRYTCCKDPLPPLPESKGQVVVNGDFALIRTDKATLLGDGYVLLASPSVLGLEPLEDITELPTAFHPLFPT